MQDFIRGNIGVIVISSFMFVVGIVVGLICEGDENGLFFSAGYPNNGGEMLTIGRTTINLTDVDLVAMSEAEQHTLLEKLNALTVDNHISVELREMVKKSMGPFKRVPVEINLHFTDDSKITGKVARACKDTPIYNNPVVAYDLKENTDATYKVKGIMSLHAYWEHQNLTECNSNDNGNYDIWVSKKHVESWIGPIDPQDTNIIVKANIVVSSL